MASGDASRFGGKSGGRPAKPAPEPKRPRFVRAAAPEGSTLPQEGAGRPVKAVAMCQKGGCSSPAEHVILAGDSREGIAGLDSATLCTDHHVEVSSAAREDGHRLHSVPLKGDTKSTAIDLHNTIQGLGRPAERMGDDLGAPHVLERMLLGHAIAGRIPAHDVPVAREAETIRGRPHEYVPDGLDTAAAEHAVASGQLQPFSTKHKQTVFRRRSPAEREARLNSALEDAQAGRIPTPVGGLSEAGRNYYDFTAALSGDKNQKRITPGAHQTYTEALKDSHPDVDSLDEEHAENLAKWLGVKRKNRPYRLGGTDLGTKDLPELPPQFRQKPPKEGPEY